MIPSARRRTALSTGALAALCALAVAPGARAFCRTTTCSPDDPDQPCSMGANGCVTGGKPLYWPGACVSFSVRCPAREARANALPWKQPSSRSACSPGAGDDKVPPARKIAGTAQPAK